MPSKYRRDIQALRGISVLAVVLFHTDVNLFKYGYLGVDAFFVISGFVITPLLSSPSFNSQRDLTNFYKRRFFRLAPALSSFLVLMALIFFFYDPIDNHALFSKQGISSLLFLANLTSYKLSGNYFSQDSNPLLHLWSLSVEAQIYLLLPILLILLKRKFLRLQFISLYLAITILSISLYLFSTNLDFLASLAGIQSLEELSYYLPSHRIWQFTCGGLVYLCSQKRFLKNRIQKLLLLLIVIISFVLVFDKQYSDKILSVYVTMIFSLLIFLGKPLELKLVSTILVWLGDRSYSIYLFHFPIIYLVNYSPIFSSIRSNYVFILVIAAVLSSFFLGSCNYHMVENRFRGEKFIKMTKYEIVKQGLKFISPPMIILIFMLQGSGLNYYGLIHDYKLFPVYPGKIDSECYKKSKQAPCVYVNASSNGKKLMLIGDSFAGHLVETTKILSKELHYNAVIWTDLSCNVDLSAAKSTYDKSCVKLDKELKNYINSTNPEVIVLSTFIRKSTDLDRIKRLSLDLVSNNRKLILIENNPIFPDQAVFMRNRPILSQIIQPQHPMDFKRTFQVNQMQLDFKVLSDRLAMWAQDNDITTVGSWDLFCDAQICSRYENGVWLYFDYNHLSIEGARKLLPLLLKSIP